MAVTSTNNLRKGSVGDDVLELQRRLNSTNYGYNLAEDGKFGSNTLAAVKDYQQRSGLDVDGIVGTKTWGSLTSASAPAATAPAENKAPTFSYTPSDAVTQADASVQQQLANKPGQWQGGTWQDTLNETISQILNRDKFSYDLNGDAIYQQYADQYVRQGKLAMMDTMGQAQAMTGGYGNSYAQAAGQQAYQGYLQQLNEVVPELYGMALDQYNQEGQNLYNQAGLLAQMEDQEYGKYRDQLSDYYTDLNYLTENARYMSETEYQKALDDFNIKYSAYRDTVSDDQWQQQFDLANEQWDWEKEQAETSGGSGGGGGNGGGNSGNGSTAQFANTLWTATGTTDENGNLIFRNSEGKTQAFAPGINPYTGTKNADAKNGTFSNGYQPNNIKGTKLKNSGISTSITGKNQTIWEANGKYWLWRGGLNKYIEVDISDLD